MTYATELTGRELRAAVAKEVMLYKEFVAIAPEFERSRDAAMQVVEYIGKRELQDPFLRFLSRIVYAEVGINQEKPSLQWLTLTASPEHICRAALSAVREQL